MKIILKDKEEQNILKGFPWVFSNEIKEFVGNIKSGEICEIYNSKQEFIGQGFLNTSSKIMVRILSLSHEVIDYDFFKKRILAAWEMRKACGFNESARVVFSEADYLPGLIVDKYGDYLSIQLLSLGMDVRKQFVIDALVEIFKPLGIYERSDSPVRLKEGLSEFKGIVYGEFNPLIQIKENNIKIEVDLENGQKTGYFLDQKQNRKALMSYVGDKVVLDCFSHTGGFALHAASYHAKKVVAVDISQKACDDILKNAKLNSFNNIEVVCDDVFDYLRNNENINKFDVIILDPPAFTKSKDTVKSAYRGYKEINLQAMKIIKEGGILFTFSCSMHMEPQLFLEMLQEASLDSKRKIRLLDFKIQSPDHPTILGSGDSLYLKCAILYVV